MSKYTTGEIAKLCNVSVRTVQFYDTKGLLPPSELTDGGRRLYTDADLSELRFICTLKDLGCSLDSIKGILNSKSCKKVLTLLLDEQAKRLNDEINERKVQLEAIRLIKENISQNATIPVNLTIDIEHMIEKERLVKQTRRVLIVGRVIFLSILSASIAIWITMGMWIPFSAVAAITLILLGCRAFVKFDNSPVPFICPHCNENFFLQTKDLFSTYRVKHLEYVNCPKCGKEDYCVKSFAKHERLSS